VAFAVCVAMISAQKTPVRLIVSSRKILIASQGPAFRSSVRVLARASAMLLLAGKALGKKLLGQGQEDFGRSVGEI
jgi:hypothetical protein